MWQGKRCGPDCESCLCGTDRSIRCKWYAAKGWNWVEPRKQGKKLTNKQKKKKRRK